MTSGRGANHTERATYELRQQILSGILPGGMRLFEVPLAEALRISRTPVREAMSRLAEEGLLDRASGGGFEVRSFTRRDVTDAIELRGVLEGTAARFAAERGASPRGLASLRAILARLDTCFTDGGQRIDFQTYRDANASFHDALASLCDSPVIQRELTRVVSLPFASPSAFVLGRPDGAAARRSLVVAQAQHHALIDAIERREGARAEAIAREHARTALTNLESSLRPEGTTDEVPGLSMIVG